MEHLFYISHSSNGFLNSSSFNQHSEIGTILHPFRWSKEVDGGRTQSQVCPGLPGSLRKPMHLSQSYLLHSKMLEIALA